MAEAAKEMTISRSECHKLARDAINLRAVIQTTEAQVDAAKLSLDTAERRFESQKRIFLVDKSANEDNLRAVLAKSTEDKGKLTTRLSLADQKREIAEAEVSDLTRRPQQVTEELVTQRNSPYSEERCKKK